MPNKHEKKRQNQTNSLCFDEFHRINFFCCLMLLLCAVRMTSNWNVILDDDLATKVWQRVTAHHNHIIAASITNNTDSIQRKEERENRSFSRRSREKHLAQTPKLFLFTRTSTFYFECVGWKSVCRSEAIHTHSSEINSDEIFLGWHFSYLSFFPHKLRYENVRVGMCFVFADVLMWYVIYYTIWCAAVFCQFDGKVLLIWFSTEFNAEWIHIRLFIRLRSKWSQYQRYSKINSKINSNNMKCSMFVRWIER